MGYMTAQAQMRSRFVLLVVLGFLFLVGVVLLTWDLLHLRPVEPLEDAV